MLSWMNARAVLVVAVAACGASQAPRLYPAGTDRDDGYGDLAQASVRLWIGSDGDSQLLAPTHRRTRHGGDAYGGDPYGGAMYGDDDPSAVPPPPPGCRPHGGRRCGPLAPTQRYKPTTGLRGAIEGTVTWRGTPPTQLRTACGPIDPPGLHIGTDHAVGGVLVYIDHVDIGRVLPSYQRPAGVGGALTKRGCALSPTLQVVAPLPANLTIHGDATAATLRVSAPSGVQPFELQEAGRVVIPAQAGVTRIEADDGSLAAAWVVASDTPYYAVTDDLGRFRLDELAAGTYDVTVMRPSLPATTDGKLVYGEPVIVHRTIKVDAARPARLEVAIDL